MQFDMRFGYFNLTVIGVSFISNQKWWEIAEYSGIMKKELPRERTNRRTADGSDVIRSREGF